MVKTVLKVVQKMLRSAILDIVRKTFRSYLYINISTYDFITADSTIADLMNFDQETLSFFNQVEELVKLNVNKERISQDKSTNNNGYRLIDICISNNLFFTQWPFWKR